MNTAFKQRRTRIGALTFTLAALFGFAVIRLVVLVALYGPRLNSLAQQEHTGESELAPVRGPIVDRNGEPLAMSAETQSVYARPKKVLESSTPAERGKLAAILMMVPISLEQKLDKASAVRVARASDVTGQGAGDRSARHRRHRHDQRIQKILPGEQPGRVGGGVVGDGRPGALRVGVALRQDCARRGGRAELRS